MGFGGRDVSATNTGGNSARHALIREVSRRHALKLGGAAAAGVAFSKPLIETIRPKLAFGQGYDSEPTLTPTPEPPMCLETKLTASDGARNDQFGRGSAISGDTVLVGSHNDDDGATESGSVYVFIKDLGGVNNWGEFKKLNASDAAFDDRFGWAVAMSGDLAIVGALQEDDGGNRAGAAYILRRDEGGPITGVR